SEEFDPTHKFYVGQDVVCVDNGQPKYTTLPSELTVGKVYKIRWLGIYNHYVDGMYLGIRVEGIDRGVCKIWGYEDPPFKASRFRPLVPDRIASLRNLLADPDGYAPSAPEGPLREPDDGGAVKEKELEEV